MSWKTASLTPTLLAIIRNKGTEYPFSGEYTHFAVKGTYLCRQCGLALFRSEDKFQSGCGWPSFDQEISHAISKQIDADNQRIEILCHRCQAHLGHVFAGEGLTDKNTRHCVNSASLEFVDDPNVLDTQEAIFAAGCFWGVEYYFKKVKGILKTEVGYIGGHQAYPTYQQVCKDNTGHFEAIRIIFDPSIINYKQLTQFFFEIHDPTQTDGQGPDRGLQYLSIIFYYDDEQKQIGAQLIEQLNQHGYSVATQQLAVSTFWPAEKYHQDYYQKNAKQPYCHFYQKKFKDEWK